MRVGGGMLTELVAAHTSPPPFRTEVPEGRVVASPPRETFYQGCGSGYAKMGIAGDRQPALLRCVIGSDSIRGLSPALFGLARVTRRESGGLVSQD